MTSREACQHLTGMFDFIFVDGDHSLEGIACDWQDWSRRVIQGGIIALHDTRVPAHDPSVANLGSCLYFDSHISRDPRFTLVEQVDSLSVLRKN
jgi:predicted O-methyltransferase YrrM